MVVFDEHARIQSAAVIHSAAGSDSVLLEGSEQRRRLTGVEDDDPTGGRVHKLPRQRRCPGETLQKIQRCSLGGKQCRRPAAILRDHGARLATGAVSMRDTDGHRRIQLAKRFRCDVEAGNDTRVTWRAARRAPAARRPITPRVVTSPEPKIFGQRLPDDLAIDAWVERFERNGLHAGGASANVRLASATSAKLKDRMCIAA